MMIIIIIGFLINVQVQGQHPHQWAPFQVAGLLHAWQISHLQICLSWGSIAETFHSLQSLSVSCFHGPARPMLSINLYVLTAPLEHSTCPYQRSLLSFRIMSRSSTPSRASSLLDLMVTMSCGLTLQICLIIALSFSCRRWRFSFVNGQVTLAWSIALRTQELYTRSRVLKERWLEERTGNHPLIQYSDSFIILRSPVNLRFTH